MEKVLLLGLSFLLFSFSAACGSRSTPSVSDPHPKRETAFPEPNNLADKERIESAEHIDSYSVEPKGIYIKLRRGQTLYALSQLYQVPLDRLMRANRIGDPNRIRAGTMIFIPGSSRSVSPQPMTTAALSWPLHGRITAKFGPRRSKRSPHEGIDIDGEHGDEVTAAAGGTVIQAGRQGKYGRVVLIDHGNGLTTLYAHLSRPLVRAGDRVERGEPIAKVGRSGNATGPHLHFEVRRNGQPLDPIPYLQAGTAVAASPPKVPHRTHPKESVIVEPDRRSQGIVVERGRPEPAYLPVPPGHLPPPGKCRIWFPDRPPGHQPPPGDCRVLRREVPPGAHLIYW
ncbi:MAG: peptidoglycan DD-metalloendopeptidase family protein [Candidatus Binatia bacterium]